MKKIRVAVNGLGRIGRIFLRAGWDNPNFEFVAANSLSPAETYAHLLKYDSIYGIWDKMITGRGREIRIDGKKLAFFQERENLPWGRIKPDVVVDASGKYRGRKEALSHLKAGARYVLVTAPAEDLDAMLVMGINEKTFDPGKHKAISAASCTSVCSSLVLKVIEEKFGIEQAVVNTIHAFTNDQTIHDSAHRDLRRARSATQSIIPTTSGAGKTLDKFFPELRGKLSAISFRVPVITSSVLSVALELKKDTTTKKVNDAFVQAAKKSLRGHLDVSREPLVSNDFRGNPFGATVDLLSTEVVNKRLANIVAWYDNEWGYVSQTLKLLEYIVRKI